MVTFIFYKSLRMVSTIYSPLIMLYQETIYSIDILFLFWYVLVNNIIILYLNNKLLLVLKGDSISDY